MLGDKAIGRFDRGMKRGVKQRLTRKGLLTNVRDPSTPLLFGCVKIDIKKR